MGLAQAHPNNITKIEWADTHDIQLSDAKLSVVNFLHSKLSSRAGTSCKVMKKISNEIKRM